MAAHKRGRLDPEFYDGLRGAAAHNPGLVLLRGNRARLYDSSGSYRTITHSTVGMPLVWAMDGCCAGVQHFRMGTPHGLCKPGALSCIFCSGDGAACTTGQGLKLPVSEQQLKAVAIAACVSEEMCWQARVPFWRGAVDFLFLQHPVVIQADGSSHFTGIHGLTSDQKLALDIEFCVRAVQARVSVIRVHDAELKTNMQPDCLLEAVRAAKSGVCVVLSTSFTIASLCDNGQQVPFVEHLAGKLGGQAEVLLPYGLIIRCPS